MTENLKELVLEAIVAPYSHHNNCPSKHSKKCDCYMRWYTPGLEALDKLIKRVEDYEEALAFYANPETYFACGFFFDRPCGEFEDDFEELSGNMGHPDGGDWVKPGKRARAALAELIKESSVKA